MDLKLCCDNCTNFQLFEGAQDVFIRLTAVCFMFVSHNPYRLPQQYKRHVCGPSCSCKHRFWWIYDFWTLVLSELYGCTMSLTTFLVNSCSLFYRPVLILQPTVSSVASDNQSMQFQHLISKLGKMCSYCVSTYIYIELITFCISEWLAAFSFAIFFYFFCLIWWRIGYCNADVQSAASYVNVGSEHNVYW